MVNKIFGIGLNKTGSTSLHRAMEILGYKSVHYSYNEVLLSSLIEHNIANNKKVFDSMEHMDCYFDYLPWAGHRSEIPNNHLYRTLDKQYPNSLFIYNYRNMEDWLKSRYNHVAKVTHDDLETLGKKNPKNIYFNRSTGVWRQEMISLELGIDYYFADRLNNVVLKINICAGEGWEKLCPFLNKDIPDVPFPCENKNVYEK